MLICENCGALFNEWDIKHKRTDADNCDLCPSCGDDDLSNAMRCKHCGEQKSVTANLHLLIEHVCDDCLDNCVEQYNRLLAHIPPETYDTLCEVYGDLKITI